MECRGKPSTVSKAKFQCLESFHHPLPLEGHPRKAEGKNFSKSWTTKSFEKTGRTLQPSQRLWPTSRVSRTTTDKLFPNVVRVTRTRARATVHGQRLRRRHRPTLPMLGKNHIKSSRHWKKQARRMLYVSKPWKICNRARRARSPPTPTVSNGWKIWADRNVCPTREFPSLGKTASRHAKALNISSARCQSSGVSMSCTR